MAAQRALMDSVEWPKALLDHPGAPEEWDDINEQCVPQHSTKPPGMAFKEDTFLTSANLCRWVVDFNEISLGKQVQPPPPNTHHCF